MTNTDSNNLFENILFSGLETTLITLELITFIIVDLLSHDYIIDAFVTYLLSLVSNCLVIVFNLFYMTFFTFSISIK
mgnify:CR=1 FL=1